MFASAACTLRQGTVPSSVFHGQACGSAAVTHAAMPCLPVRDVPGSSTGTQREKERRQSLAHTNPPRLLISIQPWIMCHAGCALHACSSPALDHVSRGPVRKMTFGARRWPVALVSRMDPSPPASPPSACPSGTGDDARLPGTDTEEPALRSIISPVLSAQSLRCTWRPYIWRRVLHHTRSR